MKGIRIIDICKIVSETCKQGSEEAELSDLFKGKVTRRGDTYTINETIDIKKDLILPPGTYELADEQWIRAENCELTIQPNTTFLFNSHTQIYMDKGKINVLGREKEKVKFLSHKRANVGSISLYSVEARLEHLLIKGLRGYRGTLYRPLLLRECKTHILNSTIRNNRCENRKHSMHMIGGELLFEKTKIMKNDGIWLNECLASFVDSEISENYSKLSGGGLHIFAGADDKRCPVYFERTKIKGNKAGFFGGGICAEHNCTIYFGDCDIENNYANIGGGVKIAGQAKFKNTRIKRNQAKDFGGGIFASYTHSDDTTVVELADDCVVRDNVPARKQLYASPTLGSDPPDAIIKYNPCIIKV